MVGRIQVNRVNVNYKAANADGGLRSQHALLLFWLDSKRIFSLVSWLEFNEFLLFVESLTHNKSFLSICFCIWQKKMFPLSNNPSLFLPCSAWFPVLSCFVSRRLLHEHIQRVSKVVTATHKALQIPEVSDILTSCTERDMEEVTCHYTHPYKV